MIEIIIAIVVICFIIGILGDLFSSLADLVGGPVQLIAIIVVFIVAFLAFSWAGVFVILLGTFIVKKLGAMLEEHDKQANEVARIQRETQNEKMIHNNDFTLMQELKNSCMQLGYMNAEKWQEKLPNFKNRTYSTSFQEITTNFAKQIEFQYLWQNDDWFDVYKRYVVEHPVGSTVTKMLAEVDCPALKMTHTVEDGDLINTMLQRGTIRKSQDVPPLFSATFIAGVNEYLYKPTPYLQRLYSNVTSATEKHTEEINFEDL